MYGCLTNCLGPGCEFWQDCEHIREIDKAIDPDMSKASKALANGQTHI